MSRKPRILVSNDDGYSSKGIHALAEALEEVGEVWVVAPNREQSAVSHALTLDRPLRIQRMADRHFAVDGTPTDCVALGVSHVLKSRPPDIVVSGINHGVNMGADVHYSGTVAAAFEGLILGAPAIAISQQLGDGLSFSAAAHFARVLTAWVIERTLPENTLLNVNVPARPVRGVALTRLGVRHYTEGVIEEVDPRGHQIFWIGGGEPVWEATPGTDFHEVAEGFISVTPLSLDMTDHELLKNMREQKPDWANHAAPN